LLHTRITLAFVFLKFHQIKGPATTRGVSPSEITALFASLISHQPAVLFSQNKPATSNQPAVLFSHNKPAPAISHQPPANRTGCTIPGEVQLT
jgi:hypothetical protein